MKANFYYGGRYLKVANKIKEHINHLPEFLSQQTVQSTRAAGDALDTLTAEKFGDLLRN